MANLETLYGHLKTLTSQWFYLKSEITSLLDGKVDKVNGKGLSTNDFTTDEKQKLAGIAAGATNITVDASLNDSSSNPVQNKAVNAAIGTINTALGQKANTSSLKTVATTGKYTDLTDIPSTFAPSAHEHSAADIKDSNAHNNLETPANANQATINSAVDAKIAGLTSMDLLEVVTGDLPTASSSTMNKLYVQAVSGGSSPNAYGIYVTVRSGTSGSYTYDWEKVDDANLQGFLTSTEAANTYVPLTDSRLTDARTPTSHTHGNITHAGAIGSDSGKMIVTTTNGVLIASDLITELDGVVQQLITYGA